MKDPFGFGYSESYDALYLDKDYGAETDLLESLFGRFANSPITSILDVGCGTGSHSILLADRGYDVLGVDKSKDMLAKAREKAENTVTSGALTFDQGDIRSYRGQASVDAVVMMFAVLGYQTTNDDVAAALATARHHLDPGGLLVFDVWYGPAVLKLRPSQRVKETERDDVRWIRATSGAIDVGRHVCAVDYHLLRLEGRSLAAEIRETHHVRFFFPQELRLFLSNAGFEFLWLSAFPDLNQQPAEDTWNVLCVARATPT